MEDYKLDTYGERIAGVYDDWHGEVDDAALATLRELAQGGRALELGIGTGRIALPLQDAGVEVHGLDVSAAMVGRLRARPGGDRLPVTLGDFADVGVEGHYALIYVVASSFFGLLSQEEQIRCFQNVAHHLSPAGAFVVEAFVPDLTRYQGGQAVRTVHLGVDQLRINAAQVDPVTQLITSQHVLLTEEGIRLYPVKIRYAWPAELDLMARLAGLRLRHRWADWRKAAFAPDSSRHVSVYEHAAQQ